MKMVTVAFDIDGTLRSALADQQKAPVARERIRSILITFSSFKNVLVHVWSGAGELYARQVVASLGLSEYVDSYSAKTDKTVKGTLKQSAGFKPDIAIDDLEDTTLGEINLIVGDEYAQELPKHDPDSEGSDDEG